MSTNDTSIFNSLVAILELSFRAEQFLRNGGIRTVGELVALDEKGLKKKCRGIGRKSINEIKDALYNFKLGLGMDVVAEEQVQAPVENQGVVNVSNEEDYTSSF